MTPQSQNFAALNAVVHDHDFSDQTVTFGFRSNYHCIVVDLGIAIPEDGNRRIAAVNINTLCN